MKNKLKAKFHCSNFFFLSYTFLSITIVILFYTISAEAYTEVYAKLSRKIESGYYYSDNSKIYFYFDEPYLSSPDTIRYYIYKNPFAIIQTDLLTAHRGINKYTINTSLPSGMYILELRNSKQEKYFLKFKIGAYSND